MPIVRTQFFPLSAPEGDDAQHNGGSAESFSREYVQELRQESAHHRVRATEAHQAAERATQEAATRVAAVEAAANQRVLLAELKTAALKAGMVDLDGLKLADLSQVTLNAQGEVEGADALMAALQQTKPYLFATAGHSSNPGPAPKPAAPKTKLATEMSDAEYKAAKSALLRGR